MTATVTKLAHHRNGIGGTPFWVATLRDGKTTKVAIRLDRTADDDTGGICCFVLDVALLAEGTIEFTQNSWRGDHYADVVDAAIRKAGLETVLRVIK